MRLVCCRTFCLAGVFPHVPETFPTRRARAGFGCTFFVCARARAGDLRFPTPLLRVLLAALEGRPCFRLAAALRFFVAFAGGFGGIGIFPTALLKCCARW